MWKFSEIPGNEDVKKALRGMVDSGRIPQAMMLYENDGGGAMPLVMAFLQYLDCGSRSGGESCCSCPSCNQHSKLIYPDVHFTFPVTSGTKVSGEAKNLTCDMFSEYWRSLVLSNPWFLESDLSEALGFEKKRGQILKAEGSSILRQLSLSSLSDGYRCVVMYLPELMNAETSNMLLKAIEEPDEKTVFILVTHAPEKVLPTISSRCQGMRVPPLSAEEVADVLETRFGIDHGAARQAAALSGGSPGLALREVSESDDIALIRGLLRSLMEALTAKDLAACLDVAEKIAGIESREKQKLFCNFAGELFRNVFLMQCGMEDMVPASPEEKEFLRETAAKCGANFCRKGLKALDHASLMLGRNVSQRMIFANLANRLYQSVAG